MKIHKWQKIIALCAVIVGIMIMVQFRSQGGIIDGQSSMDRLEDLASTLIQVTDVNERLSSEADNLRDTLIQYQEGENIQNILSKELSESKLIAGMVAMEGAGVVITLDDSRMPRDWDEDYYYIHDWYLRDIVNLLWVAGAEAISINDERIITTTEIFCGGTTIFINENLTTPPYEIRAIGDVENLTNSLRMGTIVPLLEEVKRNFAIVFEIEVKDEVIVPAYSESIIIRHARVTQD